MVVVDASAIVAALCGPAADDLLRTLLADEQLHAPDLVDYEFVSALRSMIRGGRLDGPRAADALSDFDDLPLQRWPAIDPLRRRAWALRDNLSAYDAAYVALAEMLRCPLVTRDERLARTGGHDAEIIVR